MDVETITKHIGAIDRVLVGTILHTYRQCGKQNCQCRKGKEYWHGPYHVWTRKENGKTITKSLSPKQALLCRTAIKNMKKLNTYVVKWKSESMKQILKIDN